MIKVYTIYDVCTSEYGIPFTAVNDMDCKRRVGASYRGNPFVRDLKLFACGEFDVDRGVLFPFDSPVMLCNIVELVGEEVEQLSSIEVNDNVKV